MISMMMLAIVGGIVLGVAALTLVLGYMNLTTVCTVIFIAVELIIYTQFCFANEDALLYVGDITIVYWLIPSLAYILLFDWRTRYYLVGITVRMILVIYLFWVFNSLGSLMEPFMESLIYLFVMTVAADIASCIAYTYEEDEYPFPFKQYY